MAVNIQEDVTFYQDSVVISNRDTILEAPDGSLHRVPVINSNALELLQQYEDESDEENQFVDTNDSSRTSHCRGIEEVEPGTDEDEPAASNKRQNTSAMSVTMPDLFSDKEDFFNYMAEKGLIKGEMQCEVCERECLARPKKSIKDGHIWQCSRCKKNYSIRKGTIFEKSKLPLTTIFKIIFLWATCTPGHTVAQMLPSVSETTIYRWFKICRGVVNERLKEGVFFSGSGVNASVQIDESAFGKSQKYHKGKYHKKQWIFGISQPSQHKCFLVPVENRNEKTLLGLIKKHIDTECRMQVISDGWPAYNNLQAAGYQHSVVIHKNEFVNSAGDHTNSIESIWSQFKNWINSMHGVKKGSFVECMNEFMYRFNFCGGCRNNCLDVFLEDLKKYQDRFL